VGISAVFSAPAFGPPNLRKRVCQPPVPDYGAGPKGPNPGRANSAFPYNGWKIQRRTFKPFGSGLDRAAKMPR